MTIFKIERSYWLLSLTLSPQDIWIGIQWYHHLGPRIDLLVCPLPCVVFKIELVHKNIFKDAH